MTPRETIRQAVIRLYTAPQTAWEVAFVVNFFHDCNPRLTGETVKRIWEEEKQVNIVMRQLGERPVKGFVPSETLTVAKRLLAA